MRKAGKSIIIITHKLNEVLELSDRVAVLRKGKYINTVETAKATVESLTEMMVGEKVKLDINRTEPVGAEKRIEMRGITCKNKEGLKVLTEASFTAYSGEILGVAGISGSGQKELLESVAGLQPIESGEILYFSPEGTTEKISEMKAEDIKNLGITLSFVPEDRLGMGLVGSMDLTDNMMIRSYKEGRHFFADRKSPKKLAEDIVEKLDVVTPGVDTPVSRLSGGNVQKILVGREIASNPTVLMVAYPVRGLDINSSYTIYNLLNDQKKKGVAVICVGEDLDVLLELCDKILVLNSGKVAGIVDARTTTKEKLGLMSKENVISKKEPFARMVKRDHISVGKAWAIRLIAVALSLVVAALVIVAVTKQNPIEVYLGIIDGAVGSNRRIWVTIREMMVLLCIAIGLTPAFKMKFWNIGAEGQILMGGTAAAAMMIYFGDKMPNWLLLIVIFVVSGLAGLIWGVIPAIFKAYFNTNETLFTLMLNYVAMQIVTFCIVFWENPSGSNTVGIINAATKGGWFPTIFGNAYTLNVIIVLAITLVVYVYMKYSKQGYEISVVGESQNTARYAGIDVKKVIIRTMMISGAICGIAGAVIVSGASHTISTSTAGGRGFTAIIVAWMSKFNPLAMILVSGFLVFMQQGSIQVASQFGLNENASDIITGILLFFLIGCEFFINYKLEFRKKGEK